MTKRKVLTLKKPRDPWAKLERLRLERKRRLERVQLEMNQLAGRSV